MRNVFFSLLILLSLSLPLKAVTVFNTEFALEVGNGSGSGTLINGGSQLQMVAGNNSTVRIISNNPLPNNDFQFDIVGSSSASGSFLNTHIKQYFGIVQRNEIPPTNDKKLLAFSGNSGNLFASDTHYRVDVNNEIGLNQGFTVRFTRTGNTITTARLISGDNFELINTYTILNPSKELFFEFVSVDGTSSASGFGTYENNLDFSNLETVVPEPASWLLIILGLGLFHYRRF